MEADPLRFGIIGAAGRGSSFVRALLAHPRTVVTALCDVRQEAVTAPARELGVEHVFADFGKPTQRPLKRISESQIRGFFNAGQFPPGSMGPKVEAAIRFLKGGGEEVIISSVSKLADAIERGAGTHIYRDDVGP